MKIIINDVLICVNVNFFSLFFFFFFINHHFFFQKSPIMSVWELEANNRCFNDLKIDVLGNIAREKEEREKEGEKEEESKGTLIFDFIFIIFFIFPSE